MATSCMTAARMALKGVYLAPGRWLLTQTRQNPTVCRSSLLRVSPAASLCSSRTEPQRSTQTQSSAGSHTDSRGDDDEETEDPEYIPRRKPKNPLRTIALAWMIGLPSGVIGFLLAKRQVDKNRLKQLKIRQRMKMSNEGEYEGSRYLRHRTDVKQGP